jgi:hypothetical protein
MLHTPAIDPLQVRFPLRPEDLARLNFLRPDQQDMFTGWLAGTAPADLFLAMLAEIHQTAVGSRAHVMALTSACACAFLNRKLFRDPDVVGGTPREAADKYSDEDLVTMVVCREFGAIPYFVFGDSHSRLYQHPGLSFDDAWLLPISVTCSGGSARGLSNAASNLRYGDRLRRFFARIAPAVADGVACFFKFGQVDLEYLFPYKTALNGRRAFAENEFGTYGEETIARYLDYLDDLVPHRLRQRTFVCSVSLPALADGAWRDVCAEGLLAFMKVSPEQDGRLRGLFGSLQVPDIRLRSRLHLDFNARLKVAAEAKGFQFVDDAQLFLDHDTGKVRDVHIVRGGGRDVHIDRTEPSLALIAPVIRRLAGPQHGGSA